MFASFVNENGGENDCRLCAYNYRLPKLSYRFLCSLVCYGSNITINLT